MKEFAAFENAVLPSRELTAKPYASRAAFEVAAKRVSCDLSTCRIKPAEFNCCFRVGELTEAQWELMSALDDGDIIGIDGVLRLTNTGEKSVFVREN
jgi:lysyl-tRNA synthetase class II